MYKLKSIQKIIPIGLIMIFSSGIILLSCNSGLDHKSNQAFMSEWYLKTGSSWYTTPRLYVKEIGEGRDTVVVLHGGWGAEHSYLLKSVKGLENDFHFIFYDQRGSLRSPCPDSLITLNNHINDLEMLRKELGIKKMKIMAHSQGTFLANKYLETYPEHVSSMTLIGLVSPISPLPDEDTSAWISYEKQYRKFSQRKELTEKLEEYGVQRDKKDLNSKERTIQWKIHFAAYNIYDLSKWNEQEGGMAFYNQKAGTATARSYMGESWNFVQLYKEVKIPVHIINGEYDLSGCNPELIKKWTKGIDNVDMKIIDNAGHNSWIDQPEKFKEYLKKAITDKSE